MKNDKLSLLRAPAALYLLPWCILIASLLLGAIMMPGTSPLHVIGVGIVLTMMASPPLVLLGSSLESVKDEVEKATKRAKLAGWQEDVPTIPFGVRPWWSLPRHMASWVTIADHNQLHIDVALMCASSGRSITFRTIFRVGIGVKETIPQFTLRPREGALDRPLFGSVRSVTLRGSTDSAVWICEPTDVAAVLENAPPNVAAAFAFQGTRALWFCRDNFLWFEVPLGAEPKELIHSAKRLQVVAAFLSGNRPPRAGGRPE